MEKLNDTISRQEAINLITDAEDIMTFTAIGILRSRIRKLPSAEPKKVCIARINLSEEQVREAVERTKNEIVQMLPSAQPDNQINLCDSCDYSYPDCPAKNDDVIFGNGIGNDNICACNKYKPSAQPERKKGRWLRYGEDGYPNNEDTVFWQCDQCLEQYTGRTKRIPNFCPNCGADMRKEGAE